MQQIRKELIKKILRQTMNSASFLSLVQNIALLLALVLLFDTIALRRKQDHEFLRKVGMGMFIGGIGLVIMLTPWVLVPGVIFDTRSVLLGVSGLFFGTLPTLVAMVITAAFRLYQGGGGAFTGILVIVSTGGMGIAWHHMCRHALDRTPWWEFYLFGLASHVVMLALMLTLPWQTALRVLGSITLPVLLLYPLGTVLLGSLMVKRLRRETAAEALRASEEHLRQLAAELKENRDLLARSQELAHVGTWELDLKTGNLTWTDEVYRIFGLKVQEFPATYEAFLQHVHPSDRSAVDHAYTESLDKNLDSYEIEHRVVRANTGEERFVHEKCQHTRSSSGRVIRSIGMVQDITERKAAEDRLQANQAELRRLLDEADRSRLALLSVLEDHMDTTEPGHAPSC
ncbi:MAG: LytS/YhcK type 5TM receptor domain-containing protein [Clostridia bacterium]